MGNKWRLAAKLFLFLGMVVGTCTILYFWLFRPPVEIAALSIPEEFFPSDSDYHLIHPARDAFPALNSGSQTIYWAELNGLAIFIVERLPTSGLAQKAFRFYNDLNSSYFLYADSLYHSTIADEFTTGCGNSNFGGFRCVANARYGEYVITLEVVIDEEMTIEKFENIVKYVDQRFHEELFSDGR